MTTCDFSTYNALRNETAQKSAEASQACASLETAQQAVQDAEAALAEAQANKDAAYTAWQQAEQAENQEAANLGINPVAPPAPTRI